MTTFDDAVEKIDKVIIRARRMGIRVYANVAHIDTTAVRRYVQIYGWQPNQVVAAASVNKLLIARKRIREHAYASFSWSDEFVRPGGGLYDEAGAPHSAKAFELMRDLLVRSGNTAMVVLGRGLADEINWLVSTVWRYYELDLSEEKHYVTTRLTPRDDGFFETGQTTPREALGLITDIMSTKSMGEMVTFVQDSLTRSVSHIPTPHDVRIANKHGELNGPDNDGVFVRNEVGRIDAFTNDLATYSIFTESDSLFKAKLAEMVIGQIGALLMEVTGSHASRTARLLGKTAFTN